MRSSLRPASVVLLSTLIVAPAFAEIVKVRLTEFPKPLTPAILVEMVNKSAESKLTIQDFSLVERSPLATMDFEMLVQMRAGRPMMGTRFRIWKSKTGAPIAVEAHVERAVWKGGLISKMKSRVAEEFYLKDVHQLSAQEKAVREVIARHHDKTVGEVTHQDIWKGDSFLRIFKAIGQRGVHAISYSHETRQIVEAEYREHHQVDELPAVQAMGYKIYEQNWYDPSQTIGPEVLELKHLLPMTVAQEANPFAALTGRNFLGTHYSDELAKTPEGREAGFWSYDLIQAISKEDISKIAPITNGFEGPEGLVLDGRYVAINIHPDARNSISAAIPWRYSAQVQPVTKAINGQSGLVFQNAFIGKTFKSAEDLMATPQRHPEHDVATYIQDGTDQIQVYWAVTEMMEQLHKLGFTDPEISTRKFQAYLYNPDPFYKDNAFYLNDTINFTTYSPSQSNFARDNTTIWHEIGHGIIDRLLGEITLTKGEGFHEGMADFLAELILQMTSYQREFPGRDGQRIYNITPFNMSNEAHDDGEAFGGLMKDILDRAISKWGQEGVLKMADLILEAMRLTRGHPALDEQEWVEKMRFADSRGSAQRLALEFETLINEALIPRNFSVDSKNAAAMILLVNNKSQQRGAPGSRNTPLKIRKNVESVFNLIVRLKDSETYKFTYPVTIKVGPGGKAEGAVDWLDEDAGPKTIILNSATDEVPVTMTATGKCDVLNTGDACRESIFVEVYSPGDVKPRARQRVYVQIGGFTLF